MEVNTVFALFYFDLRAIFQVQAPVGLIFGGGGGGRFNGGFFALPVWGGGLILGRAYTWRGLFSEFYGINIFHVFSVIFILCGKCK